jgi:hypothetical protein
MCLEALETRKKEILQCSLQRENWEKIRKEEKMEDGADRTHTYRRIMNIYLPKVSSISWIYLVYGSFHSFHHFCLHIYIIHTSQPASERAK